MQSRACWSLAASMLACLALATPRAQAADAAAAAPATSAAAAPKSANADDAAAVAFSRALQQHAAGDLEGARSSMLESYRLSNRAELLYNIGKIQSALGECSLALAAYRDYLEKVPDGRYRTEASQASAELEAQCPSGGASASTHAAPAVAAAPLAAPAGPPRLRAASPSQAKENAVPSASKRATTVRWVGWSAIAAGGLAGGAAVYFMSAAIDARDRLQTQVDQSRESGWRTRVDVDLREQQQTHQRWAQILGVTGGVFVVGGTLALLLGPRPANPTAPRIELQVLPSAIAASYGADF